MKKKCPRIIFPLMAIFLILLLYACTVESKGAITQLGEITTIDPDLRRVYVKIPLGYRHFMVLGHIDENTVYLKAGHSVTLSDFHEGEPVIVQWRDSEKGQVIVTLEKSATHLNYY
jgi:hypothetical protein